MISLHQDPKDKNVLVVETPYDKGVLSSMKATIPYYDRAWDPKDKVWLVSAWYGEAVAKILKTRWSNFRPDVSFPIMKPSEEERIIKMEYIGTTKERENGQEAGFGFVEDEWTYIFPRSILESFFTGFVSIPREPKIAVTLYSILQVDTIATSEELKAGYRRMARIWHPDINKEPNANDMFIEIQRAYDMLSNPSTRGKYDFGLKLEAGLDKPEAKGDWSKLSQQHGYRSPLTCGMLHVTVKPGVRNQVTVIHNWKDIVNDEGKILVTSWPKDASMFTRSWA